MPEARNGLFPAVWECCVLRHGPCGQPFYNLPVERMGKYGCVSVANGQGNYTTGVYHARLQSVVFSCFYLPQDHVDDGWRFHKRRLQC